MTRLARTTSAAAVAALLAALSACGSGSDADASGSSAAPSGRVVDLGLVAGYEARLVADGFTNPTGVTVSPLGVLTVCDSGNGRVVLVRDGVVEPYITGFTTEPAARRPDRARIGPLSAVWVNAATLAVTDAGQPDGAERVLVFGAPGDASTGRATNPIPATTADPADRGEGQLTGLSVSGDGRSLYLAANGSDARTWLLRADLESMQLYTFASADQHAIPTGSPVATIQWDDQSLLALYRGSPGSDHGLIVQWSLATARPLHQWSLPGLDHPTAMARLGDTAELAIVTAPGSGAASGKLARVRLPTPAPAPGSAPLAVTPSTTLSPAVVTLIGSALPSPTSCTLSPDGRLLYVTLAATPSTPSGFLVAITGFRP